MRRYEMANAIRLTTCLPWKKHRYIPCDHDAHEGEGVLGTNPRKWRGALLSIDRVGA
jgi:hypothetical protein